ncbi:MAG: hypothetical protein JF609_02660, partial [Verrucomicrobia bacterium]|nr:hypothetical protein [Verrucomicrobiota bacterium]
GLVEIILKVVGGDAEGVGGVRGEMEQRNGQNQEVKTSQHAWEIKLSSMLVENCSREAAESFFGKIWMVRVVRKIQINLQNVVGVK